MIRIRLAKGGKKNDIVYKIVAVEKKLKNTTGKAKKVLGTWHPKGDVLRSVNKKEIASLVSRGAVVSEAVKKLLAK